VSATIEWDAIPLLPSVRALVEQGHKTGASARNWESYGARVSLGPHGSIEQALLTDPQTSGGLLVACAPEAADAVLGIFHADGFGQACIIGDVRPGEPNVRVI
jgi:selenide, water dikinase